MNELVKSLFHLPLTWLPTHAIFCLYVRNLAWCCMVLLSSQRAGAQEEVNAGSQGLIEPQVEGGGRIDGKTPTERAAALVR